MPCCAVLPLLCRASAAVPCFCCKLPATRARAVAKLSGEVLRLIIALSRAPPLVPLTSGRAVLHAAAVLLVCFGCGVGICANIAGGQAGTRRLLDKPSTPSNATV